MEGTEHAFLPIFPLPIVLVPGELLPLHIFEERYKSLMRDALDDGRRFGLSHVENAEVGTSTPPVVGSIGCAAEITAVVPLDDGRMNVLSVGGARYVVRGYSQTEPYLIAEVEYFADDPDETDDVLEVAGRVRGLFERLASAARTLSSRLAELEPPQLDVPPEELSFIVVANVSIEHVSKQPLLEMRDTKARLDVLETALVDLVDSNEYRATMNTRAKSNGHGRKVPDE